jgi:hypothetical protein
MSRASMQRARRSGITVLGLLLLIIALMLGGFFLVRYLRSRQTTTQSRPLVRPASVIPSRHQPLDELNLTGMIKIMRGDTVDLFRVGPHAFG